MLSYLKNASPRELISVLKYHESGRFGIVNDDAWFWIGDVFHKLCVNCGN